jgi:hypothetical protein
MEKENHGLVAVYTLENTRMTKELKERCMSYRQIVLTHYILSSMIRRGKRLRKK